MIGTARRSPTSAGRTTGPPWRRRSPSPGTSSWSAARPASASPRWSPPSGPAAITEVIEGSCLQLAGQPLPLAALEQIFDARGGWPAAADGAEQQSPEQRLRAIRLWADALAPGGSPTADHPGRRRPALGRRDHLRLPRLPGLPPRPAAGSAWCSPSGTTRRRGSAGSQQAVAELTRLPGARVRRAAAPGPGRDPRAGRRPDRQRPTSTSRPGTSRRRATPTCSASW